MNTGVPSPTRPTGTGDDGELSSGYNLVWKKIITLYVKQETTLYENCQKSYALIFGNCNNHIFSKLEAREYYQSLRGD